MGNYKFDFKHFSIKQERTAMKVGTDGVLLGAWISPISSARILDIGTGTGLIALMLAQRFQYATVDAIEIDHEAAEEAKENVANSSWPDRINVIETSLNDYHKSLLDTQTTTHNCYDFIVTNPPFYNATLKPDDNARAAARHADSLPFGDITRFADRYLSKDGKLAVIYPTNCEENIMTGISSSSLKCITICDVFTVKGKPAKRRMAVFGKNSEGDVKHEELFIRDEGNNYTQQYIDITRDFYLHL